MAKVFFVAGFVGRPIPATSKSRFLRGRGEADDKLESMNVVQTNLMLLPIDDGCIAIAQAKASAAASTIPSSSLFNSGIMGFW